MRSRGPRGATTGGHPPLIPIAWGEVQWSVGGAASWRSVGGEFWATPTTTSTTETILRLAHAHNPARCHVQLTAHAPEAGTYEDEVGVAEVRESRTGQTITVRSPLDVIGYSILVLEEQ